MFIPVSTVSTVVRKGATCSASDSVSRKASVCAPLPLLVVDVHKFVFPRSFTISLGWCGASFRIRAPTSSRWLDGVNEVCLVRLTATGAARRRRHHASQRHRPVLP